MKTPLRLLASLLFIFHLPRNGELLHRRFRTEPQRPFRFPGGSRYNP